MYRALCINKINNLQQFGPFQKLPKGEKIFKESETVSFTK